MHNFCLGQFCPTRLLILVFCIASWRMIVMRLHGMSSLTDTDREFIAGAYIGNFNTATPKTLLKT